MNMPGFAIHGKHVDREAMKLDICGTENGRQVAWVTVNKDGTIAFLNREGSTASCSLDDDLKVGSKCSVGDIKSSQVTSGVLIQMQASTSTSMTSQSGAPSSADLWSSTSQSASTTATSITRQNTDITFISGNYGAPTSRELLSWVSMSSPAVECSCKSVNA